MKEMVIDRQEWYRKTQELCKSEPNSYESSYGAFLKRRGQEKYCCLGIWSRDVLEIPKEHLDGYVEPTDLVMSLGDLEHCDCDAKKALGRMINNKLDKFIDIKHVSEYKNAVFGRLIMVNDRDDGFCGANMMHDWSGVTDSQQEELIKVGFREIGISVKFIN